MRIAAERDEGEISGFVVTFDDMTELLSAQRKAAWADVARRIAHEIKNPLTPIQLSAERLKRKYLKEIKNDPETFRICTDTIIRHVGDIGRMVDEFSSFARMPAPVLKHEDLPTIVEQAVFLQRTAHPEIGVRAALRRATAAAALRRAAGRPGARQHPQERRRSRSRRESPRADRARRDTSCVTVDARWPAVVGHRRGQRPRPADARDASA